MTRTTTILVVEDSDEDFATLMDVVKLMNIPNKILRADSGTACLRILNATALYPKTLPILVLMDLNTPNDDGRDALRAIKQDPLLQILPLVVLSTSSNPRDLDFCYGIGVNAYHVKPVSHLLHLQVVQDILSYWLSSAVLPNSCYRPKH